MAKVPKNGSLKFEGIPVDAKVLTLLELHMVAAYEHFNVRFTDVPLN